MPVLVHFVCQSWCTCRTQTLEPTVASQAHNHVRHSLSDVDLLLQVIQLPSVCSTMSSPDQEQDTDIVQDINHLPEELRTQIAAWVEQDSLPALRLVSRHWNDAANLAVRQLGYDLLVSPAQWRLIGQKWPNLEQLDLHWQMTPDKEASARNYRELVAYLTPITRLEHLGLSMEAALLPEGQELILRQTRLLSLRACSTYGGGASDGLLQFISKLSHLTRLECDLHAGSRPLKRSSLQVQSEPATDEGVRCLSSLQSLKDLSLTYMFRPQLYFRKFTVTAQALSTIGSLHQLAHLCLSLWPMVDTDLDHLTHLQLHSLELRDCVRLTSGCLMHLSLLTSLHTLSFLGIEPPWDTAEDLDAFEVLADEVMPFLTTLNY